MITDFALLDRVLGTIQDATEMAVLHREREVAMHEVTTDVDLIVGEAPLAVMRKIAGDLRRESVCLVMVFHYDRGAYSCFFADPQGLGGAQVDLLHDSDGVGRYGVKTDVVLANRRVGSRWPRADDLDEALYVCRKAQMKGDGHRLASVREQLPANARAQVSKRGDAIFSKRAASEVADALANDNLEVERPVPVWRSRAMRPSRLVRRCGFWVRLTGEAAPSAAEQLARRMSGIVQTLSAARPTSGFLLDNLWRPRLLVSLNQSAPWPKPDVVLPAISDLDAVDDLAPQLVASMHRTVVSRFGLERRATGSS